MSGLFGKLCSGLKKFYRDTSANPSVEFVLIAPMLFWMVFSVLEIGWLNTQKTMLERGLNLTIRDLRLGLFDDPTPTNIKARICENSLLLRDCVNAISIELLPLSANPPPLASCVDRVNEVSPNVGYNPGARSEIMFVRACVVVDPLLPGMAIGAQLKKDASGGLQLVAYSAFMNEPG